MKNLTFLMLCLFLFPRLSAQETEIGKRIVIKEAGLTLALPNSEWGLKKKVEAPITQYFFMRSAIQDGYEPSSTPNIYLIVEDASKYADVEQFSKEKQKEFNKFNLEIKETLTRKDKNYPLRDLNAIFIKSTFELGTNQVLYMVHLINKEKKGIQIYLYMDKNLCEKYGSELWTTVKSIKEA